MTADAIGWTAWGLVVTLFGVDLSIPEVTEPIKGVLSDYPPWFGMLMIAVLVLSASFLKIMTGLARYKKEKADAEEEIESEDK